MNDSHTRARRTGFLRWLADPLILPRPGENPLADLTLGRSPKSRSRARRALAEATLHLPLYGSITFGASYIAAREGMEALGTSYIAAREGMEALEDWMILFASCQIATTILMLLCLPFRKLGLRSLRVNWNDYRMAGIQHRQILVGMTAIGVRAARAAFAFFLVLALLQLGPWLWTYVVPNMKLSVNGDIWAGPWPPLIIVSASILMTIAALDLALWIPLGQSMSMALYRLHPAALIALLMQIPLTSTIALFLLIHRFTLIDLVEYDVDLIGYGGIGVIILLALLRPVVVAALWHRTLCGLRLTGLEPSLPWRPWRHGGSNPLCPSPSPPRCGLIVCLEPPPGNSAIAPARTAPCRPLLPPPTPPPVLTVSSSASSRA